VLARLEAADRCNCIQAASGGVRIKSHQRNFKLYLVHDLKEVVMKRVSLFSTVAALTIFALCSFVIAQNESQDGRPLSATLTGAAEVPGPGDPDGSGEVHITLNQGQGLVCFQLSVADIATATAAHIHRGPVGVAGPVVVGLTPPASGFSSGCVSADPDLIKDIRQNPEGYYVNVHNSAFPAGAIRGQLSK
jgi:hypothetical protein